MSYPKIMQGKTVIITGASSGIGKGTAIILARMGAVVVMACRDRARGEAALDAVQEASGSSALKLMMLDLASQASVRQFARDFSSRFRSLDVLINNAAVIMNKKEMTDDGFETTFEVNYLSHFLLTNLLLPKLVASAPSRIVNITSGLHADGVIDFKDIRGKKHFSPSRAYAKSKLAMVMFTYELARKLKPTGVTVNCAQPAGTATNLGKSGGGLFGAVTKLTTFFAGDLEKGAETPVYVAASPALTQVTGKYFVNMKEESSSEESYDEEAAKRLWDVSMELTAEQATVKRRSFFSRR